MVVGVGARLRRRCRRMVHAEADGGSAGAAPARRDVTSGVARWWGRRAARGGGLAGRVLRRPAALGGRYAPPHRSPPKSQHTN